MTAGAPSDSAGTPPRFAPGDRVRVGRVEALAAIHPNPEGLAYGGDGTPRRPVYRVAFRQADLWEGYAGSPEDATIVDIFEHWLEPAEGGAP
jgi:hypothetical protein